MCVCVCVIVFLFCFLFFVFVLVLSWLSHLIQSGKEKFHQMLTEFNSFVRKDTSDYVPILVHDCGISLGRICGYFPCFSGSNSWPESLAE